MNMERFDYLAEIQKSNNYDIALLTTFNFEIDFFEHFILNALNYNGIKKIALFVDGGQLSESLKNVDYSSIGKRYTVNPIHMSGAFHPKLLLLLSPNGAKLIISSANLTMSGFCSNSEIANVFVYDASHPENLKAITCAISFFEKLERISYEALSYDMESDLFKEIRKLPYYGRSNVNDSLLMVDNIEESILEQVHRMMPITESIDIAVPYYDNDLSAINELCKLYPKALITLYLQNGKGRFPPERVHDNSFTIFQFLNISLTTSDESSLRTDHFYHGKVLRFETENKSFILYGSANCTKSALCLPFLQGGNIECDVLEVGEKGEFDSFFEGFQLDNSVFSCEAIEYTPSADSNIWFKYGVIEKSQIRLCFGFTNKPGLLGVDIGQREYQSVIIDSEIHIDIPADQLSLDSDIFDVSFRTRNGEETVRCWLLNRDSISLFRLSEAVDGVLSFHLDSSGDKYIEDRITLIQALALSVADLEKNREVVQQVEQTGEDLDGESDGEDGGIIDYVPPSIEMLNLYKRITAVGAIERSYRFAFHKWVADAAEIGGQSRPASQLQIVQKASVAPITDEDRNFGRFVRTACRKMLHEDFIRQVQPEDYFNRAQVFFEIIDKYTVFFENNEPKDENPNYHIKNPIETLFSAQYATEIKSRLILILAEMDLAPETREDLLTLTMLTIVMNHIIGSREPDSLKSIDGWNKKILASINGDDEFRETGYMQQVLSVVDMLTVRAVSVIPYPEIKYVDSLFGYKSIAKVKESIYNDYGSNAIIRVEDNSIYVHATVDRLRDYMTLREGSLRDINNYAKYQNGITSLIVTIEVSQARRGPNPAVKITYIASNLPSTSIKQTITKKSGKTEAHTLRIT